MLPVEIRPTKADRYLANALADQTGPRTEQAAEFLTWGADEHISLRTGDWLVGLLPQEEPKYPSRE
jgi:hypothetical protein